MCHDFYIPFYLCIWMCLLYILSSTWNATAGWPALNQMQTYFWHGTFNDAYEKLLFMLYFDVAVFLLALAISVSHFVSEQHENWSARVLHSTSQMAYYTFFKATQQTKNARCVLLRRWRFFHFIFNIHTFFASRCNNCNNFLSHRHNQISFLRLFSQRFLLRSLLIKHPFYENFHRRINKHQRFSWFSMSRSLKLTFFSLVETFCSETYPFLYVWSVTSIFFAICFHFMSEHSFWKLINKFCDYFQRLSVLASMFFL